MSRELYLNIFNKINFNKIIDHPNILIAANFWEEDRYQAAKTCYKFMREIDDLIDNHKARFKEISKTDKTWFESQVRTWLEAISNKDHGEDPFQKELICTIDRFKIPLLYMENFAKSMIYDIDNDGFDTVDTFLKYSRGASVAPSSVFVHLCGISSLNGIFREPEFNVWEVSKPCAIFSYLVHIIRDFQKDQLNNLNYFADDVLNKHCLNRNDLAAIARGGEITQDFRYMMQEYVGLAENYRKKTQEVIDWVSPLLEPRYRLSILIIYQLYLMVYERINVAQGSFTTEELNPTADEIKSRVYSTIINFTETET